MRIIASLPHGNTGVGNDHKIAMHGWGTFPVWPDRDGERSQYGHAGVWNISNMATRDGEHCRYGTTGLLHGQARPPWKGVVEGNGPWAMVPPGVTPWGGAHGSA